MNVLLGPSIWNGKSEVSMEQKEPLRMMLTGNYAAAYGAKLARVEAIPVYPITPQTTVMEKLIELISNGELDAEYVPMESEHSVMAAAVAAEATGARVFTASSSQGIAYMHENLFGASGLRLPIVMAMVNRSILPPISIYPDQSDSLAQRDTGWIQYYVENAQEIIDTVIQAYRVAEHKDVLLPVAVCYEGLIISHFLEPVELPPQSAVDEFLPPYRPEHVILDPANVMHITVTVNDEYLTEYRYQQEEAMENARAVIRDVEREYAATFGRSYGGLLDPYRMDDAEVAILSMGSNAGVARRAVDELRAQGLPLGSIKLRVFRPFPGEELKQMTENLKLLIILERGVSIGSGGIVHAEVAARLYSHSKRPALANYVAGLGGRVLSLSDLKALTLQAVAAMKSGTLDGATRWVGVRGLE
jgi:2-oxoisovalerate ferredoxin oxidoreductase alpha subunit